MMKTILTRKRLALALVVLPLALLASGCHQSTSGAQPGAKPNPKLEAIRAAGAPVTLAELSEWYATPTADENAAPLYAEAFAALGSTNANSADFLEDNQKALGLLHRAAARPKCRYPVDLSKGSATPLPHLSQVKKGAQLLAQAAKTQAAQGQMDLAAQSILDGLAVARSVEQEPILISRLVQIASDNILQMALETVLSGKTFSSEQLTRLQSAFAEAESGVGLSRPLAGERCLGIAFFQASPEEQAKMISGAPGATGNADFAQYQKHQKSPLFSGDFDFYLDRMEEWVTATAAPFPQSLADLEARESAIEEAKAKGYLISGMYLPSFTKALESAAETTARLRVTQTALAVERYRASHQGALPDLLSQLTPQFLGAVPADPFDGRPVRYKKLSVGYVIYSVGKDGQDNGGTPKPANAKPGVGFDNTFTVRR